MKNKFLFASVAIVAFIGLISCDSNESGSNVSFRGGGNKPVYVKGASCKEGGCQCDGYMGTITPSGNYKGKCINSDGWGHTCGHSPSDHGL